jgi:hypothetical protein
MCITCQALFNNKGKYMSYNIQIGDLVKCECNANACPIGIVIEMDDENLYIKDTRYDDPVALGIINAILIKRGSRKRKHGRKNFIAYNAINIPEVEGE